VLYIIRRANVRKDKKQVGISLIVIKQKMNRSVIKEKSVSLHSLSKTEYRWFLPLVKKEGALAQVVEQWTENPCVLGSTPRGTTPPFILPGFPAMEFGLFCALIRRKGNGRRVTIYRDEQNTGANFSDAQP
jgi:hypothetical protein